MVILPRIHGLSTPYPWYFHPPIHDLLILLHMVCLTPNSVYFDFPIHAVSTLHMVFRPCNPCYIVIPTHCILFLLNMVYRIPTHDIFTSISMIFWPIYTWYIDPQPMVVWSRYTWYFELHNLFMEYRPLPIVYAPSYTLFIDSCP